MNEDEIKHIYLSTCPTKELLAEYVYRLITLRGNLTNAPNEIKSYIRTKIINRNLKSGFVNTLTLNDLNWCFCKFLKIKLHEQKKFDSFTLPSSISNNQFKNRSPLPILQEKREDSYKLIEKILTYGFPIVVGNSLYVFYCGEVKLIEIYRSFYQEKKNLKHYEKIAGIRCEMIEGRDYLNALIFIIGVSTLIKELKLNYAFNSLVVWRKAEMEGSFFELSELEWILNLLGKSPKDSNLSHVLAYFYMIRNLCKKDKKNKVIIESLLEKFSYYLLEKNVPDSYVINQLVHFSVELWRKENKIKILNKKFIVKFMEEATNQSLNEYFELGQIIRNGVYAVGGKKEESDKIIDRLAKDLRNESLPGGFAETLQRDLIRLKDKGFVISKELGEKLKELSSKLFVCDLFTFYLIKSSIIFGLLSPR
jgi:hypothetical protein